MIYSDMHTHGRFSDGKGSFSEFAESAVTKNIGSLGFSDHAPVPIENEWSMKISSLGYYFSEIDELKKNTPEGLEIYAGMELDYIPGINVKDYIGFDELPLDYFIGSVHYVYSEKLDKFLGVDDSPGDFKYLVEQGFDRDADAVYRAYYANVREMISSYIPSVAAHIDLVTKNNLDDMYFNTDSNDYLHEVDKTLDIVKLYGTIIEVNSGGMSRGYMDRPYPSEYILRQCIKREIPVALNSDAHSPEALAFEFDNITEMLKNIGLAEIITYKKAGWTPVQL